MDEMWVRGIFFYQVLRYIRDNKGQDAYDLMGSKTEDYRADKKYDFVDFCDLLARADMVAGNSDNGFISKMSMETMMREASWKVLFRRMDPRTVFTSTQRQEGRHLVAEFSIAEESDKRVKLEMKMWTKNAAHQILWADFYKGRLEGIFNLMGRKGSVTMQRGPENGIFFYVIEWQ